MTTEDTATATVKKPAVKKPATTKRKRTRSPKVKAVAAPAPKADPVNEAYDHAISEIARFTAIKDRLKPLVKR